MWPVHGDLHPKDTAIVYATKHYAGYSHIYLDGKLFDKGGPRKTQHIRGLEPGAHSLRVVLVDEHDVSLGIEETVVIEVEGVYGFEQQAVRSIAHTKTVPSFLLHIHDPRTDVVSGRVLKSGLWEEEWVHIMWKLLYKQPQRLMVDVGANLGFFGLYAASMGHRVVAFEPLQTNLEKLVQSIVSNQVESQVEVRGVGLSDREEEMELYAYGDNLSNGFLVTADEAGRKRAQGAQFIQSISSSVLDLEVEEEVFLIKMDIEGLEPRAIAGAQKVLARGVPHILLEYSPGVKVPGFDAVEMLHSLYSMGYHVYNPFDHANRQFEYTPGTFHLLDAGDQYNLYLTREHPSRVMQD